MDLPPDIDEARAELRAILPIFFAPTKKDLVKYCRTLQATIRGLSLLIENAELFGFHHQRVNWEWVPPHLAWTAAVSKTLREGTESEKTRAMRKLSRVFKERRLFVGHLFYKADGHWHLLYFDQRDRSEEDNQWKHGAHIHLLNYLVRPQTSLQGIAEELDKKRPSIKSEIHIRYRELDIEDLKREKEERARIAGVRRNREA